MSQHIAENLHDVQQRIAAACATAQRPSPDVTLLAVSKTWPAEDVLTAWQAGQSAFGENYVQEGVAKIERLRELAPQAPLEWHFIGPLQSNKTALVAQNFHWVHSIDRLKIAQRLSQQRDVHLPPLQVCLQVNVSGEDSKSGIAPAEIEALAHEVAQLPRLHLRGLMCIPEPTDDPAVLQARFGLLRDWQARLNAQGLTIDTLSMGMSHDLEEAIAAGSTLVRVGTAIFGARHYPHTNS